MHAAAVFLLAIQCLNDEYSRADTRIERKTEFALVKVARPRHGTMTRQRAGNVTVYTGVEIEEDVRSLRLYAARGGQWWQLRERGGEPVIDDRVREPVEPVLVRREGGLVAVTYTDRSFHGPTAKTLLLDFRTGRPRVELLVECTYGFGRGMCVGASSAREPRRQLACDARLRCTSTETQWIDWTTRSATRAFDLLTDVSVPPSRLGTISYSSGKAYAEAFAADRKALGQRVVIDRIGPVTPVFELARDSILFAGPIKEGRVGARFFHLTRGHWREIALTRLSDGGYPGAGEKADAPSSLDADHTPDAPQLLFFAWNIEYNGKGRLVEVVAREGEARSLYWIMFDPNGRTSAIRIATDKPEFRHCDNPVYPPSVTSLGIPDWGLPVQLTAIRSWRMWDLEQGTMPKHCEIVGRLGWSSSKGWQPMFFEAPCTDPSARPHATTLDDDGTLGFTIVKPRS